ncbi:hypothetical protein RJ639_014508 [Escallonia herrerae]|uniref:PIG-P domain-containing protein n=1 Tax=Escallonia herrerae TaxID=1293975 RepID=A0AA88VIX4_9ASTE|nr:hypothetical protein RJ639_014508 [Escallonia herrerae]
MLKDKAAEDPRSVSSPRRVLSFSKNRRATVSFPDSDEKASKFHLSRDHGPNPSEVYGFVGAISTVVVTGVCLLDYFLLSVMFLVWAYFPDHWLHSVGIFYYPSRYWALAVPACTMVTVVMAVVFYIGLNFMATPPPTSFNTIFDEFTRESLSFAPSVGEDEQAIEPISDIGISQINELMLSNMN